MAPGGIDSDGMELSFGRMARGYLPYEVDQQLLLPPDMRSWLPEGHLAYFVLEVVAEFDLSESDEGVPRPAARPPPRIHCCERGVSDHGTRSQPAEAVPLRPWLIPKPA